MSGMPDAVIGAPATTVAANWIVSAVLGEHGTGVQNDDRRMSGTVVRAPTAPIVASRIIGAVLGKQDRRSKAFKAGQGAG